MNSKKKETIYNRSVPFNTEAETYVLGCVFIDNKIIDGMSIIKNSTNANITNINPI